MRHVGESVLAVVIGILVVAQGLPGSAAQTSPPPKVTGGVPSPPQAELRRRAALEVRTAVAMAMVYLNDHAKHPASLRVLREGGYANVPDKDPWGNDYVVSPTMSQEQPFGGTVNQEIYVFSPGPTGRGEYPVPFRRVTGANGSIGFSSLHGEWGID
jgi:hypothetical protein